MLDDGVIIEVVLTGEAGCSPNAAKGEYFLRVTLGTERSEGVVLNCVELEGRNEGAVGLDGRGSWWSREVEA